MTLRILTALLFASLFLGLPATAQIVSTPAPIAGHDELGVFPAKGSLEISIAALRSNDTGPYSTFAVTQLPEHGDLEILSDRLIYTPDDTFWSLGLDSLTYSLTSASGSHSGSATVALYAVRTWEKVSEEPFESEAALDSYPKFLSNPDSEDHSLTLDTAAHLSGQLGLAVHTSGGHAFLNLDGQNLGGQTGSGGGATVGMGCIPGNFDDRGVVLMALGGSPLESGNLPILRVSAKQRNLTLELLNSQTGQYVASQSVPLQGDRAHVELEWWTEKSRNGDSIGAFLRVDGLATVLRGVTHANPSFTGIFLGLIPKFPNGAETTLAFDSFTLLKPVNIKAAAASTIDASDDFEDGSLGSWSAVVGTGLSVTADAAASGNFGLESLVTGGSYALGGSLPPALERTTQFHFDTDALSLSPGDVATIYAFGSGTETTTLHTKLRLRVHGAANGNKQLLMTYQELTGPRWAPITVLSPGSKSLVLQYRAATTSTYPNGYIRLWIDGEPVSLATDLNSLRQEALWSHLGFYGTDPGTSGWVDFDNFLTAGR